MTALFCSDILGLSGPKAHQHTPGPWSSLRRRAAGFMCLRNALSEFRIGDLRRSCTMKFVSFRARGAARYGAVDGNRVVDLTSRLKYPDLKALIVADALAEAARAAKGASADFMLDEVAFDPVIPNPGKIICVGLN